MRAVRSHPRCHYLDPMRSNIVRNWVETVVSPLQPAFEIDVHVGRCIGF